jgi:hypothetical protein
MQPEPAPAMQQAMQPATVQPAAVQPATVQPATVQPVPPATETVELPIFREIEAVWFRSHNRSVMDGWTAAPVPSVAAPAVELSVSTEAAAPPMAAPSTALPRTAPPSRTAPPARTGLPTPAGDEMWRTTADDGWRAASAAAQPAVAGTTRSGLAKRIPAANLVPGGVEQPAPSARARRSPEDIRGLLSAYHRGVQRGRTGDAASSVASPDPSEENRR